MRASIVAALMAVLLFASPVLAQEQSGIIQGIVHDASGAVLPGATVEVRSPSLVGVSNSVTDATGVYRFPALPPGIYEVTVTMQSFSPVKMQGLELRLGQLKQVNFTLSVAGVTEALQVTAESPLIDVKQSASFANIHKEFIAKIPRGRDYTSLVTMAPGANNEGKLAGISIDGASAAENKYVIDGIDTTDIQTGRPAKPLLTDFVEEIQVKSSGYNAEFGGSTGGTINVISRSGANTWNGDFGAYFRNHSLTGDVRPTLRRALTNTSIAEYIRFPKDDFTRWEPIMSVGGPIRKDKLWFFGGYVPDLLSMDRTVTFSVNQQTATFNQEDRRHNLSGNLSAQLSQSMRAKFSTSIDYLRARGRLPAIDGTGSPAVNYAGLGQNQPRGTYTGSWDYVASSRLFVGARAGYFRYDTEDIGIPAETWYRFQQTNIGLSGVPAQFQQQLGFSNLLTNSGIGHDLFTRTGFSVDATYYANAAGQHTFKGGVQFDRYTNDVFRGNLAPYVDLQWGLAYTTLDNRSVQGPFGYYVWSTINTVGNVNSNNLGFFFQDAWTVNNHLTLNLGVRTEREKVPSFNPNFPAIDFSYADKLAPRFGFAYDVKGDGKWKAYGSFGIFYDIMKLELARGLFGADKWVTHAYTLDSPDWTAINPPSTLPGRFIEDNDLRHVNNDPDHPEDGVVDPNLKPFKSREFTLGLERELNASTSVGVRYVRKQVLRAIEDQGTLTPNVGEIYAIANVGFGPVQRTASGVDVTQALGKPLPDPRQPRAQRDYDGLEIRLRRRVVQGLYINTSYLWSRLYGNYSGLSSSDEQGRSSPNVNRFFDLVIMSFDQNAQSVLGRLQTDRPNQWKTSGFYDFPFGTSIGMHQLVAQGTPISHRVNMRAGSTGIYYLGRGSAGRTPVVSQTDLYVQHEFKLAGTNRVQVSLNVLNLFDQEIVNDRFQFETQNTIAISEEDFFKGFDVQTLIAAQNRLRDPRFLKDSGYQSARELRFGFKLLF